MSVTGPTASRKEVKIKSKARAMSISILNSISEADKAKLLAALMGNAAVPAKPESEAWRAGEASYKQKRALLAMADAKVIDIDGAIHHGKAVALPSFGPKGKKLTFGKLFSVEDRDGKRNFPVLWTGLTAGEASDIYPVLKALPDLPEGQRWLDKKAGAPKPKASGSGFRPKAAAAPSSNFGEAEARFEKLEAKLQQLIELQFAQPAKPVAATGHTKKPAKPVEAKPEKAPKVLKPGDSIWVEINGEAVEKFLSADSKRLNATK